jgi:hypothetical protein
MTLIADKRARPAIWLFGASIVAVLCYWFPLAVDRSMPPDSDSRIWMLFGMVQRQVFLASLVAVASFCFLIRAAKRQFDRWSILLLGISLPVLLVAVVPGFLVVRAHLEISFHR